MQTGWSEVAIQSMRLTLLKHAACILSLGTGHVPRLRVRARWAGCMPQLGPVRQVAGCMPQHCHSFSASFSATNFKLRCPSVHGRAQHLLSGLGLTGMHRALCSRGGMRRSGCSKGGMRRSGCAQLRDLISSSCILLVCQHAISRDPTRP